MIIQNNVLSLQRQTKKNEGTMEKVLSLMLVMSAVLTASAQVDCITIDRDVTFSGPLFAICKGKELNKNTVTRYEDGVTFYIKNSRVAGSNYVSFWIETTDGRQREYNSWKDNDLHVSMCNTDKGTNAYVISDDTFKYLTAIEMDDGKYGVQLFTFLKK